MRLIWRCIAALLLPSLGAEAQQMRFDASPSFLLAATGPAQLDLQLRFVTPAVYQLFSSRAIGVRWNGRLLPKEAVSYVFVAEGLLRVSLPEELIKPGLGEIVLWDENRSMALPLRLWVQVLIPGNPSVFGMDTNREILAMANTADGTRTGAGGRVEFFSLATGHIQRSIAIEEGARVLAFTPDTEYAWIARDLRAGRVARMNLTDGSLDQEFSVQTRFGAPYTSLKAQVFPPDPQILFVTATAPWGNETRAYANGQELANGIVPVVGVPIPLDDRGRLVLPQEVCAVRAPAGLVDCRRVGRGSFSDLRAVWKNRGADDRAIFDLDTKQVLLELSSSVPGRMHYLSAANRLVFENRAIDGDTLRTSGPFLDLLPPEERQTTQVLEPDWIVFRSASKLGSIFAGRLPQFAPNPEIARNGIVQAATGRAGSVAPGMIITLFGSDMGPAIAAGPMQLDALRLATEVEHTRVFIDNRPAAILYADGRQINAVVPADSSEAPTANVQVVRHGNLSKPVTVQFEPSLPGLFSYPVGDRSYAAAIRADGRLQGQTTPLRRGEPVVFFATGCGLPAGVAADTVAARAQESVARPSLTIGGKRAEIQYAGVVPGFTVGMMQINAIVPADVGPGAAVEVGIEIGGKGQGNVWVAVQ